MENRGLNMFVLLALVAFAQSNLAAINAADINAEKATNNSETKPINVQVFYESLCNDSINFVKNQFTPVYDKFNKFIKVVFIPFALGKITNTTEITCERDAPECEADKVHACGIDKIKDQDKLVKFVNCALVEVLNNTKTIPLDKCGKNSGIDNDTITSISNCVANSTEYMPLLNSCRQLANDAKVVTVPKIILNKNSTDEKLVKSNFLKVVCDLLPEGDKTDDCKTNTNGSGKVVVGILPILAGLFFFINFLVL